MKRIRFLPNWRIIKSTKKGCKLVAPMISREVVLPTCTAESICALIIKCNAGLEYPDCCFQLSKLAGIGRVEATVIVDQLIQTGVMDIDLDVSELNLPYFDRQIRFFDEWAIPGEWGIHKAELLSSKTVVLFGVGGYGSWIADLLVRVGIRKLIIVDPDIVSWENLHRQFLFNADDVGRFKVEAAKDYLQRAGSATSIISHAIEINSQNAVAEISASADFVFNCFGYAPLIDRGSPVFWHIARGAATSGVPCLLAGGPAVGPILLPSGSPCIECVASNAKLIRIIRKSETLRREGPAGTYMPRLGIVASAAVWEASRFMANLGRTTILNNILVLDSMNWKLKLLPFDDRSLCKSCRDTHHDAFS